MLTICPSCERTVDVMGVPAVCPICQRTITTIQPPPPPPAEDIGWTPSPTSAPSAPPAAAAAPQPTTVYERRAPEPMIVDPAYYGPPPAPEDTRKAILLGILVLFGAAALFAVGIGIHSAIQRMSAPNAPAPKPVAVAVRTETSVVDVEPVLPPPPEPIVVPEPTPLPLTLAPTPADLGPADVVTDKAVNAAIERGVTFLINTMTNGELRATNSLGDRQQGQYALAVLALLYAGESTLDQRLSLSGEFMSAAMERMKASGMGGEVATYSRSIRAAALALHNRQVDRPVLTSDLDFLLNTHSHGAYGYNNDPQERGRTGRQFRWDNSNSQYGVLGVWAAAEAGYHVPRDYWQTVEGHWTNFQRDDGGWGYRENADSSMTMTAAGVNMLFVARDQLNVGSAIRQTEKEPFPEALRRGLEWLSVGGRAVQIGGHAGYALYGLERAGLASGFKRFGEHDWFRVLAAKVIQTQHPTGSWDGNDGAVAETAFRILFLSRGRHPLSINKLRFEGAWNNRGRDLVRLNKHIFASLERPVNWQVVALKEDWTDWMDAPVLYIASHEPPEFTTEQIDKLRAFADAGGMIFTHADASSDEFNAYVEQLTAELYPQYPLVDLPEDHPIYSALYAMENKPPLKGVSNGARLLLVHSPTDMAIRWQHRPPEQAKTDYEMGVNLFVYATGKHALRHRLDTLALPTPRSQPIGIIGVGQLRHGGSWNPEPAAWPRMARIVENATSIKVEPQPVDAFALDRAATPLVHLTTTRDPVVLSDSEGDGLRRFVDSGGVLFVDVTGGNQEAAKATREAVLKFFPGAKPSAMPAEHPVLAGTAPGMSKLEGSGLRVFATDLFTTAPPLEIVEPGQGVVIFSQLDVTSGWLGTTTWGIIGYTPEHAQTLMKNLLLWTVNDRVAEKDLPRVWRPAPTTAPSAASGAR